MTVIIDDTEINLALVRRLGQKIRWLRAIILIVLPILMLFSCLVAPVAATEKTPVYTVAVDPQFPPMKIHRDWTPILERLTRETGFKFELKVAPKFSMFEEAILAGAPDFAFMNPYHEIMAKQAQGYQPLARDSGLLAGILVVRHDDPIKSLRELDGKEIAFPAPNVLGASLLIRAILSEQEKIRFTPVYVKTHSNVYRHALLGKVAAGGGANKTLEREPPEVRANLRILLETPGVPPHPLSAHPRVPAHVQQAVTDAILKMGADPASHSLLKEIQMPNPVKADYARDYQPLEKLRLEQYVAHEK